MRSHICIFVAAGVGGIWHKDIDWYSLKHRAVILVPPDEDLCDGADGLHQKISVVVCHCGVFGQDMVHIPDVETCMKGKCVEEGGECTAQFYIVNMHKSIFELSSRKTDCSDLEAYLEAAPRARLMRHRNIRHRQ